MVRISQTVVPCRRERAAVSVIDNQGGYSHKNQNNRNSRQVLVVSGRDVVPELFKSIEKKGVRRNLCKSRRAADEDDGDGCGDSRSAAEYMFLVVKVLASFCTLCGMLTLAVQ